MRPVAPTGDHGTGFAERPRAGAARVILAPVPVNHGVLGLLARQDGLITLAQAARHGLPARTLAGGRRRRW